MATAQIDRKNEDIVSAKSAYALVGSLLVGLVLWGGAIVLVI